MLFELVRVEALSIFTQQQNNLINHTNHKNHSQTLCIESIIAIIRIIKITVRHYTVQAS